MTFNEIILNPLDATFADLSEHWFALTFWQRELILYAIGARSVAGEGTATLSQEQFLLEPWTASIADLRAHWGVIDDGQRRETLLAIWARES